MKAAAIAAAAGALLLWAPAAAARTADYSVSEEKFKADADALNVSKLPDMPSRGTVDLLLEDKSKLDRRLKILSIACSIWKVDNPLLQMVERTLASWDADGTLAVTDRRPLVRVRIEDALATMRCVEVREMNTRCITSTSIRGEATVEAPGKPARTVPVSVTVEQQQTVGVCDGLARGTALSGRNASIALADRLKEIVAQ